MRHHCPAPPTLAQPWPQVLVTRPQPEAARWVQGLQAQGVAAQALPLLEIAPANAPPQRQALAQALADWQAGRWRAVMFVSPNAVRYFFEQNQAQTLTQQALLALKTRVWAPGPGTAQALYAQGWPAAVVDAPSTQAAAQFDSEALWPLVRPQLRPGDAVLIVRGMTAQAASPADHDQAANPTDGHGRDWLAQRLRSAGVQVQFAVVYQRQAPYWQAGDYALARQAALASPSNAAGVPAWLWLLSSAEALGHLPQLLPGQSWAQAHALATHPRIAEAARALGFGQVHTCRPSLAEVAASIKSNAQPSTWATPL